jgi:hypothetical protein
VKRLVLASGNPGKLKEIRALLAPLALEVVSQAELGIAEADEPHPTYLENALAKARNASRAASLPALADDSGLSVTRSAESRASTRRITPGPRARARSATGATMKCFLPGSRAHRRATRRSSA